MPSWSPTLVNRSRSRTDDSLLPISAPQSSGSSRAYTVAFAATLLFGAGVACVTLLPPSRTVGEVVERAGAVDMAPNTDTIVRRLEAAIPNGSSSCRDTSGRCADWAKAGECERNSLFMHKECAASCGRCAHADALAAPIETAKADAQGLRCAAWAQAGECEKNPRYMSDKCHDVCDMRSDAAQFASATGGRRGGAGRVVIADEQRDP